MYLVFSHGKESGPWGFKIRRLAPVAESFGFDVSSIDYQDLADPDDRVSRLLGALPGDPGQVVLAGSSMGGYVSLVASETAAVASLFLLAPAVYVPGFGQQSYASRCEHIEIVHGWSDDVIPAQNAIDYAREADATLHLISGDHPLNESIDEVEALFRGFLQRARARINGIEG